MKQVIHMSKCSYCGKKMEPGTGKVFAKSTGKAWWFCSKKCEKNFKMGRNPKNLTWIEKSRK